MENRTLLTERGSVSYWVAHREGAKALVFLHGLTADHTLFDAQWVDFAQTYTVLAWDAPAHGRSRPYDGFDYLLATEHLREILKIEGITKAVLIGQSMGGFIAQLFLDRFPEMGEGFIGIGTCPLGHAYYSASDRWWLTHVEPFAKLYPAWMLRAAIVRQCACTQAGRDNMRKILAQYQKAELCSLMGVAFGAFLTINREVQLPCPTLLLIGEKDHTGKVRAYNERWHAQTGYPLVTVPDAAHNANADNPTFVRMQIAALIASLP